MDYSSYIQSEQWHARRRARLDFARRRCEICNRSENLEVHHRTYERLGNEELEDLLVVCSRCHDTFHHRLALHSPAPAPDGAPVPGGLDIDVHEVMRSMEAVHGQKDFASGVPSGFDALDALTAGWQPGTLNVVAGRPGMGTTALLLAFARNAALHPERATSVLFLTTEMSSEQVAQRLITSEARVDAQRARTGRLHDDDWPKLARAAGRLSATKLTVESLSSESVQPLVSEIRARHRQRSAELVIVDSIYDLPVEGMEGRRREDQISEIARALKSLVLQVDVPVLVSARVSGWVERRGGSKRPLLSDIDHGDGLVQRADVVMFIYRAERYGITVDENGNSTEGLGELLIGKQRNGPIGDVKVAFVNQYARFENLTSYLATPADDVSGA